VANVLVTGSSSGFGKMTSELLLRKGHTVVASMRGTQGKNSSPAEELAGRGATVVEMDVTDDDSVESSVAQALEASGHLDVVVNNAGLGCLGVQETFTPEDWNRVFDVNLFGVQRVIRAVLPGMREQGSGLLLQVSSLLGRVVLPFYGPYNASKWALEAMCENYRVELSSFGIDVAIVEPGGFATTFAASLIRPSDESRNASLGEFAQQGEHLLNGFEQALADTPGQDPQNVADAIVDVIETPAAQRRFRTTVDKMGMADAIDPYNDHLEKVTFGLAEAMGMADMLKLKPNQ
jgi:NAD(P)-dependent dehydrogenase (short-subunit alcohol dehydrogenase family)